VNLLLGLIIKEKGSDPELRLHDDVERLVHEYASMTKSAEIRTFWYRSTGAARDLASKGQSFHVQLRPASSEPLARRTAKSTFSERSIRQLESMLRLSMLSNRNAPADNGSASART
jgi:hypothetical protein